MTKVFLWALTQHTVYGYDTYDGCIVAACSEEEAKEVYPSIFYTMEEARRLYGRREWPTDPDEIIAEKIGVAEEHIAPNTLIMSSYRAG